MTTVPRRSEKVLWLLPLVVAIGLFGGLWLAGSQWTGPAPGATDPGALVGWGLPIARAVAVSGGALAIGWLIAASMLAPQGRGGMLSPVGRRDAQRAGLAALVWWVGATLTVLLGHAMMIGLPLRQALAPSTLATYVFATDTNIAFFVSSLAAAAVAAATPWLASSGGVAWLLAVAAVGVAAPGVTGHSHGLGDHGLAITSGLVHALGASAWLGSLVAVSAHVARGEPGLRRMLPRFATLVNICLVALAASGLGAAYARVERFGDLFTSGYGLLVVGKVVLLAALAWVAMRARGSLAAARAGGAWRWLVAEGALLSASFGVAAALTRTPNTRIPVPLSTPQEELLGFPFPPPPTVRTVLIGWHPEPFWLAVGAVMLGGYLWGVRVLRRRGIRWSAGRTASWMAGVAALTWATSGSIAAYAVAALSLHMLQHMVLAMLVPVFLVLGAPLSLALRALRPSRTVDRGPREWLVWTLHHPVAKVVTHPSYVLAITVMSLYGLYFTGLFPAMMSNHLGHLAMQVHFIVSGYLFYWIVIGVDPSARIIPHWMKMIILLVSLALHGFFGIAVMMMREPLGAEWFGLVQPPWLLDPLRDTYTAGGIAWALGELPTLIVLVALSIQWARSDERAARRIDRAADRDGDAELRAYNARLAALEARDKAGRRR